MRWVRAAGMGNWRNADVVVWDIGISRWIRGYDIKGAQCQIAFPLR